MNQSQLPSPCELKDQIEKLWDKLRIPDARSEVGGSDDNGELFDCYKRFAQKHWRDLNFHELIPGYADISLASSDYARVYFLGSYLWHALDNTDKQERPGLVEIVLYIYDTIRNLRRRGTLRQLSKNQLSLLRQFLSISWPAIGRPTDLMDV